MKKLEEYCLQIKDGEHGSVEDVKTNGYYLLSNKNLVDGSISITDSDRKISKETFERLNKRVNLEEGDVLLSSVGTIGKTVVVTGEINYAFQRSVGIIKPNPNLLNPYYLKYLFDTPTYQKALEQSSNGGVQKGLYLDDLKNIELPIPDLTVQERVVNTIKPLDEKIRNNNKISAELESLAKTIYDYWFLQFEFPNDEGKPYRSSGGKMVWSEELKREIPEGWEVKILSELLLKIPTTYRYTTDEYHLGTKYPIIDQSKEYICGFTDDVTNLLTFDDCIIFGDHTKCVKYVNFPFARGADGTKLIASNNKKISNYLLYQQILDMDLGDHGYSRNFKFIADKYVLLPTQKTTDKYTNLTTSFRKSISKYMKENIELTSLRDFLLPLLMNGQAGFED